MENIKSEIRTQAMLAKSRINGALVQFNEATGLNIEAIEIVRKPIQDGRIISISLTIGA